MTADILTELSQLTVQLIYMFSVRFLTDLAHLFTDCQVGADAPHFARSAHSANSHIPHNTRSLETVRTDAPPLNKCYVEGYKVGPSRGRSNRPPL